MSYSRWTDDCDVYVFAHVDGGIACLYGLGGPGTHDFRAYSRADLTAHLAEHEAEGHKVPAYLFNGDCYDPADFARHRDGV